MLGTSRLCSGCRGGSGRVGPERFHYSHVLAREGSGLSYRGNIIFSIVDISLLITTVVVFLGSQRPQRPRYN